MKSHLANPKKFTLAAKAVYDYGTDYVYLVDSAGSMFPNDIKNYFNDVKNYNSKIMMGFHGHDNLSMAAINTITAYECGYDVLDVTLKGLGRSAGNAASEIVSACLIRRGKNIKLKFQINFM